MKYSKDPLVSLVPLQDFLKEHKYFSDISFSQVFDDAIKPTPYRKYFHFGSDRIVCVYYGIGWSNFGTVSKAKLELIEVAFRDGVLEYENIDRQISKFERKLKQSPNDKSAKQSLRKYKQIRKLFPSYAKQEPAERSSFENYLVDTGIRSEAPFARDFVVLDVETNGLRFAKDDLLSISLFSPKTGKCYNRFLPLDQQPVVLTGWINGITTESLERQAHMTQEEFDELVREFDLKNVTILTYSGGDGSFDLKFWSNYCKRQGIRGYEDFKFENIKSYVPEPGYGTEGQCTKDNLCRLLDIEGVSEVHSGMNDCILEWKLFEALKTRKVFFIQNHLFEYNSSYIVPVTYLNTHPCLADYAELEIPQIYGEAKEIFSYRFPDELVAKIRKFPTNISGITIENALDSLLRVEKQDNSEFLVRNKKQLTYLGSLDKNITEIPVITEDDGTIRTTDERFEEQVEEINAVTGVIKSGLGEVADFVRFTVFENKPIVSQELVVSQNGKLLALADLSSEASVMEVKTYRMLSSIVIDGVAHLAPNIAFQLYSQAQGRKPFAMEIDLDTSLHQKDGGYATKVESLSVKVYEITFREKTKDEIEAIRLSDWYKPFFDVIKENPNCTYRDFMAATNRTTGSVQRALKLLKALGLITKTGSRAKGQWKVLKEPLFF